MIFGSLHEILTQLIEAYRKIRNTCRFMLSNLYDFNPDKHRVPYDQLPELDRWALHQAQQSDCDCQEEL